MLPVFERVGVVGLGLIGGSIALAVRQTWPETRIIGVDNRDVLDAAVRMHAIDVAARDLAALAEARPDVVVLAAPVRQNVALLSRLDAHLAPRSVVTDTGSTKRDIVAAAAAGGGRFTFIGGHPMGGGAVGGLDHARADLFSGRPWIFTPPPARGDEGALERLCSFAAALGANPHVMTADEHDHVLAYLSHLPQLTASALMQVVGEAVGAGGLALAGGGLVDTTRLATSPADIWRDIAAANADQIAPALDALITALQQLRNDLASGDRLDAVFAEALRWRDQLVSRTTL
jgi:prephenate dehydrogenase